MRACVDVSLDYYHRALSYDHMIALFRFFSASLCVSAKKMLLKFCVSTLSRRWKQRRLLISWKKNSLWLLLLKTEIEAEIWFVKNSFLRLWEIDPYNQSFFTNRSAAFLPFCCSCCSCSCSIIYVVYIVIQALSTHHLLPERSRTLFYFLPVKISRAKRQCTSLIVYHH